MEERLMVHEVGEPENVQVVTEQTSQFNYPRLFASKTLLELCNTTWTRSENAKNQMQPYLRGCKWSPDGTCCLVVVNKDGVHLTELPQDLYQGSVSFDRAVDALDSIIHIRESGLVYDFCWYPGMNSRDPDSCCWLTTKQNAPVQLWDAFDGYLRCSYRGYNAVDEMEPALSVTFNVEGSRIIAGYKKVLRTFDVERPGRDCAVHKINSSASCFAVDRNLLAMGSWNATITLYNINQMGTYKSIGKMHGHTGGVTHLKFTPDSLKLISGARKDHRLMVWDIRYYRRPLNVLNRVVDTNQRIYFDVSPCGKFLITGGTDGVLKAWDVDNVNWKESMDVANTNEDQGAYRFPLYTDCCNGVSIHPIRPILATSSGQYHFNNPSLLLRDNATSEHDTDVIHNDIDNAMSECDIEEVYNNEHSLMFWWIGHIPDLDDDF